MNNLTSNFSEDMSKYTVLVPALHTTAEGASINLPPVTFVFDTSSNVTVATVVAALQQYVDEHKVPRYPYNEAYICTWLARNTDLDGELTRAFEYALRKTGSLCRSLGYYLCNDQDMNLSRDAVNNLRIVWVEHCITELLMLKDKEMNEKHNYKLLRPVKFKDVQVGDELVLKDSSPVSKSSVAYKANKFVVLRFSDGSEGTCYQSRLEINYGLQPLCWVEGKPVYPGDGPLYYKDDPAWMYNEEGVFATSVRDDELHFHGGTAFPIDTATWAKPEQKREPSFQVEGQDVFPGDVVYYYGANKDNWGDPYTVKENTRLVQQATGCFGRVESFDNGAEAFRLKPMLVIGDHLVPMPVRDTAEMKNGEDYYIPSLDAEEGYLTLYWTNHGFDFEVCDKGLVHLTKEAAIAHGEALVALSKKKD